MPVMCDAETRIIQNIPTNTRTSSYLLVVLECFICVSKLVQLLFMLKSMLKYFVLRDFGYFVMNGWRMNCENIMAVGKLGAGGRMQFVHSQRFQPRLVQRSQSGSRWVQHSSMRRRYLNPLS